MAEAMHGLLLYAHPIPEQPLAARGVSERAALWHRTERVSVGVWKLALFYGRTQGEGSRRAKLASAD